MSQPVDAKTVEEATVAVPVVADVQPDEKTRRYDRQLRLWASSGQAALEAASILVINAGATSTSSLKNLVLPGIGAFTILDHESITHADAGNNFFLHVDGVGLNRAEEAVRYLRELNDSVKGVADTRDITTLLATSPDFFSTFTLVIAVNVDPSLERRLASALWSTSPHPQDRVPLMIVRTAGFYAMIGVQIGEHTVLDAHSETPPSLRLDAPFQSLIDYANTIDLDVLDATDFGHVPWIVLLVKALESWKATHGGSLPKTYAEKQEAKKSIQSMRRRGDEENFDEAMAQAYRMWTPTTIPSELKEMFKDPAVLSVNSSSPSFFLFLRALSFYTAKHSYLPLVPTLPDMHTTTATYVTLQNLFRAQAEQELLLYEEYLKNVVAEIGGAWNERDALGLGRAEVKDFIKNAAGVRLFRGREWGSVTPEELVIALQNELESGLPQTPAALYIAFLAASEFAVAHGRQPTPTEEDNAELVALATAKLKAGKWDDELPDSLTAALGEVARANGSDMPTTAALVGGMVAQEAIKFVTRQYIPVSGTCMVDLIKSATGTVPF